MQLLKTLPLLAALIGAPALATTTVGLLDGTSLHSTFEDSAIGPGDSIYLSTGRYGWTNVQGDNRAYRAPETWFPSAGLIGSVATGAYQVQYDTDVAIAADLVYELRVDIGFMSTMAARSAPYTVQLGVLDSAGVFTSLVAVSGVSTMVDHFGLTPSTVAELSYTSVAGVTGDLAVRLSRDAGGDSNSRWLGFDNVVLTATAVPEPSTTAMLLCGVAGLALWRRRQTA